MLYAFSGRGVQKRRPVSGSRDGRALGRSRSTEARVKVHVGVELARREVLIREGSAPSTSTRAAIRARGYFCDLTWLRKHLAPHRGDVDDLRVRTRREDLRSLVLQGGAIRERLDDRRAPRPRISRRLMGACLWLSADTRRLLGTHPHGGPRSTIDQPTSRRIAPAKIPGNPGLCLYRAALVPSGSSSQSAWKTASKRKGQFFSLFCIPRAPPTSHDERIQGAR